MEKILENKIKRFLSLDNGSGYGYGYGSGYGDGSGYGYGDGSGDGSGYGYGYGSGYGYGYGSGDGYGYGYGSGDGYGYGYGSGDGSGYGYGYGSGYGYGYGSGDGYGYGDGSGDGSGIKSYNGNIIYLIDNVPTIIKHINKNVAKGFILNNDFSLEECFIVKGQNKFAHGETLQNANQSLQEKIFEDLDSDEAIQKFREKFTNINKKYKIKDFYLWHHLLTGSCEMGRKSFAKNHNLDIENDRITIKEFINLTENDYGGEIIKRLKEYYE